MTIFSGCGMKGTRSAIADGELPEAKNESIPFILSSFISVRDYTSHIYENTLIYFPSFRLLLRLIS